MAQYMNDYGAPPNMRYSGMRYGNTANTAQQTPMGMRQADGMQQTQRQAQPSVQQNNTGLQSLFGGLKIDEEKAVIIFLLIILARNGAEMPLLAALGYLLM